MEKIIQIQWTCKTIEEARSVASFLVHEHLVACDNLLPHVESLFFEEEECRQEKEVIKEKSSYGRNAVYLEWVEQNVQA